MQTSLGSAPEIKVLSTHAALEVLSELGPQFETATGYTLSFSYDPANAIKRQIEDGAAFEKRAGFALALSWLSKHFWRSPAIPEQKTKTASRLLK